MRLGLVIYGNLEIISGGFLYLRKLVEHLRSRGDEVDIISLPWRPYPRALLDNLSSALRKRLSRAQLLLQDELAHPSLFRLNRRLKSELPGSIISVVLHLRSCEIHPPWKHRIYRGVEQQYLRSVDGFIYISHAIRREVEKLAGGGRPWVVAYPGGERLPGSLTVGDITRRAQESVPLKVVAVANVIPRKGLHILVAALARLPRGQWRLQVAGSLTDDPPYVRVLRRQISEMGLQEHVDLLGTLAAAELSSLLTQAHLLAVPSFFEALGIVYLEAMRFGLPAIAATAGGADEVITHGVDGFLVPPGDAPVLADCLRLLLEDRQRLSAMSLAAWERSRTHPTWEEGMSRARRFLLEVAGSG